MADDFLWMRVAQILDKTTVVISGPGTEGLTEGNELRILAVGREIPNVGVPLVVPKATVRVASNTGPYVVARTTTYEVEITSRSPFDVLSGGDRTRKETRRHELTVNEKDLIGNPASSPVAVGDPVVRPADLAEFVAYLAGQRSQE